MPLFLSLYTILMIKLLYVYLIIHKARKIFFFTFVMFQKFRQFDPKQHQIAENNFFKTSEMSEVTLAVSKKEAEP